MKKLILLLCAVMVLGSLYAQNIKLKKGIVLVDGKPCMKYDNSNANNVEFTTNDGSQTIFLKFIRTGVGHNGGLYTKVVFVESGKSLTTRSYIFTKKLLVEKLLANYVISGCAIDESKIDKFIMKFDEKIEETLIRY